MTDITPLIAKGKKIIKSYGDSSFIVNSQKYTGSLIIFPDSVLEWPVKDFAGINESTLEAIIAQSDNVDILLIGCGKRQQFLDEELTALLRKHGISADTMDTGAACRTYNVLLSEERRVATALITV